jgi:hypothetical protein
MTSTANQKPLGDMPDAFFALLRAQIRWGQDVFEAMTGTPAPNLQDVWTGLASAAPKPVCAVPPPCWMPRRLGDCVSHVSACASAKVRIVVTNCDRVSRLVRVRAEGDKDVSVSPESATLGPMQRATFEVSRAVPDGTESGTRYESLIWIEGSNQHVFRWTVSVGTAGLDSCHEQTVDDCPDYRHHWYDHFYCQRSSPRARSDQSG